jgi:hypothetical protein
LGHGHNRARDMSRRAVNGSGYGGMPLSGATRGIMPPACAGCLTGVSPDNHDDTVEMIG